MTACVYGTRAWLGLPWRDLAFAERHRLRSVACWLLICRVQCFQECHQSSCFRRTEVFPVGRHISPALDHLTNKLIFCKAKSHSVERRPALTSFVVQRMTVVTLLRLKNERTMALQCRPAMQEFSRNRLAAPGVHHRAPGCVLGQMSQSAEAYGDQQNREYRNRPAFPALLPFACYKRKRQQDNDSDGRTNQQDGRLGRRGQEREQSIQPQKEEVGTWGGLNDRRIRLAAWTKGTKMNRTNSNRNKNETGEENVLPYRLRHERHTLLVRESPIFLQIRGAPNDATRHGPFVDSQFQHHKQVHADKSNQ